MTSYYRQRPARFDIELVAGEDLSLMTIDLTEDDEPYDFTGATLAAYVYSRSDLDAEIIDPTPLATLTVANSAVGQVAISTTDTVTEVTLGPGVHGWACESTLAGITRIVIAGKFTVRVKKP